MFIFNQIKALIVLVFIFIVVLCPLTLIAIPFKLKRRLQIVCPIWEYCMKLVLRYACGAYRDIAEDHRTDAVKGTPPYGLYIANHQSYVDIPLIITVYQVPPIMKKEVLYIPIIGLMGWILGAMPVERSRHGSRRRVFEQTRKRLVADRIAVQVYPEGTRSRDASPMNYSATKQALVALAYKENIPVIPTSIYGTRGIITRRGFINTGRHVGIIVHQEMHPRDYKSSEEFSRATWSKVREGYEELRSKLERSNES